MKGGVIEDDGQGFRDLLAQQPEEADEDERIHRTPQRGADHVARREEGGDHVQPLAAHRRNGVLLPDGGPGAAVGMYLREARFIEIGHRDLTVLRLPPQGANLLLCFGKFCVVALFFRLCRVRFHTNAARFKTPERVLTCTGAPPAATWRAFRAVKVSGAARAQVNNGCVSAAVTLAGAPLRARSGKPTRPCSSQRRRVALTVCMLSACWSATCWQVSPAASSKTLCARSRTRQWGSCLIRCCAAPGSQQHSTRALHITSFSASRNRIMRPLYGKSLDFYKVMISLCE